jgi:putative oxidoreductase
MEKTMSTVINRGMPQPVNTLGNPAIADTAALIGRILLAILFIKSGWGKIGGFEQTAGYMASKGLPMAEVLLVITILLELVGGAMLVVGYKARWAALAFAAWLVPVTLVFHQFWGIPAEQVQNQTNHFFKNVAIFGGMLVVFAFGPGRYSLDAR